MTYRGRLGLACGIAALLSGAVEPAQAQTSGPGGRLIYEASYFTTFSPSNALQIVQRVPGFTLDIGNTDVRGFGQAAGNIVINGQRPSSKSDTLDVILQRIPAAQVARVEVGPGELFGSEYAAKPQVVNIVLKTTAGLSGTVTATVRREYTGVLLPEGNASVLLRSGNSTFNAAVGLDNASTTEEGPDHLIELPSGRLVELRLKENRTRDPNAYASASWAYDGGENRTAHLNGRVAMERFSLTQSNNVFPETGPVHDDRLTQRYHDPSFEIGGDVTRPFAGGGLKLIGLATRKHRHDEDVSLNRIQNDVIGGSSQLVRNERNETVLRLVWNRSNLAGWSVESGVEGALNRLDSNVDIFAFDGAGGKTRIDLPIDHAIVKEYRGEAFVNGGRPLTSKLRMDLGLTFEASRLTVSGDATAERVLKFLKPKAVFDWRPGDGWHAQLSVQRTVAQLQFEDFISTAELTNDRVNGGNANLVPQRAWEILGTVEHPIFGDGLAKLEVGFNRIALVQDRILTPEGFDAPGNLGDGREFILRGTVDTPLSRFGIKGGRLTLYGSLVDTSVKDPYTHLDRHFSGTTLFVFDVNFRQDLGKFAWGFDVSGNTGSTYYRLNELDNPYSAIPYVTAFVEYRPTKQTTISFNLDNATGVPAYRKRTFFLPDRRTPEPDLLEIRERNRHIVPYITLKHSFG